MAIRPLKLSLTTFLKISSKKPKGKIGEIRRFTGPGGYDFYKRMKQISARLAKKEITFEEAKRLVTKITKPSERTHTLAAIEKLQAFLTTWNLEACTPPEGMYVSSSELLKIKLTPDLAFSLPDGRTRCLHIWNLARPELDGAMAGEGLWLLRDEIGGSTNEFSLLDLRRNAVAEETLVTRASEARAKFDLMLIEEIWKDLHNPSISVDDTIRHIASLSP